MNTTDTREAHLAVISPELIAAVLHADEAIVTAALHQLAQRGEVWKVATGGATTWLYVKGNGEFVAADLFDAVRALKKEKTS